MKPSLKVLLSIIIIIVSILFFAKPFFKAYNNTDTVTHKIGCRLFDFNTIIVEVEEGIELNDIEIKGFGKTVFQEGKQKDKLKQLYGHTVLEIYHKEILIAEVGHRKFNNWHTHEYKISITNPENLKIGFEIIGPDGTNDSFLKRLYYNNNGTLVHIDFINQDGEIYHSEKRMP